MLCCGCKAVTIDGTMYEVSGVMSGGLSDLARLVSQRSVSIEQSEARVNRMRAIHNELRELHCAEVKRRQRTSQTAVTVDAQNKLLEVAQEQRNRLVRPC